MSSSTELQFSGDNGVSVLLSDLAAEAFLKVIILFQPQPGVTAGGRGSKYHNSDCNHSAATFQSGAGLWIWMCQDPAGDVEWPWALDKCRSRLGIPRGKIPSPFAPSRVCLSSWVCFCSQVCLRSLLNLFQKT